MSVPSLDLSVHTLNTSSSKHKFSFPKADRFGPTRKSLCDSIYQVPSTKTRRAPSFGYGNKDIGIKDDKFVPPPGSYTLESEFDQKKRGYSFGTGRQQMRLGGPLANVVLSKYIPGPGNYKNYTTLADNNLTIKPKLPDKTYNYLLKNPGPGAYHLEEFGKNNYYITSKHQDHTHMKISPPSRLQPINKSVNIGPGQYNTIQSDLNPRGRYPLSKNQNSKTRLFDKSPRAKLLLKHMLQTPPPGAYTSFSQFGPI